MTFKIYFKRIFGCSKLMLHSKCPLLRERPKGKYCQTVRIDQVGLKLYYDWVMQSFKMNPHFNPILIENPECLASETRKCLSTLHWLVCKNPLAVVDRWLSHDILVIVSFTSLSWGTPLKVMR